MKFTLNTLIYFSAFVLMLGSVVMIYLRHKNDGSLDDEQDLYLIAREVSSLINISYTASKRWPQISSSEPFLDDFQLD